MNLRPRLDLGLIRQSLRQLSDSTYFERRLHDFSDRLVAAIDHVLLNPGKYDDIVEADFAQQMRLVHGYLSGSTNNEVPYEVVYCLNHALSLWTKRDTIIITQLTNGHDFHFMPADPWQFIRQTLVDFDSSGFDALLVMIGVPRLYAHKPIFCIPLYHELGHFIDLSNAVTDTSLVLAPARFSDPAFNETRHRNEYFADLFASCFVGRAAIAALEAIAPNDPASITHPATVDRISVVESFLAQRTHPVVAVLQTALTARGLRPLASEFSPAAISSDFDDLRTFIAPSMREVHGLFEAAWNYMMAAIDSTSNPWGLAQISVSAAEAITNDLTEKSIRNFAIRKSWDEAT